MPKRLSQSSAQTWLRRSKTRAISPARCSARKPVRFCVAWVTALAPLPAKSISIRSFWKRFSRPSLVPALSGAMDNVLRAYHDNNAGPQIAAIAEQENAIELSEAAVHAAEMAL